MRGQVAPNDDSADWPEEDYPLPGGGGPNTGSGMTMPDPPMGLPMFIIEGCCAVRMGGMASETMTGAV